MVENGLLRSIRNEKTKQQSILYLLIKRWKCVVDHIVPRPIFPLNLDDEKSEEWNTIVLIKTTATATTKRIE